MDEVEHYDWEMPDTGIEYIDNFKFVKHKKCEYVPKLEFAKPPEENKDEKKEGEEKKDETKKDEEKKEEKKEEEKKEESDKEDDEMKDKPLGGKTFAIAGKLSMKQSEMREFIEENGGYFSTTVNKSVDYLVATSSEYERKSNKINSAKRMNIPIVDEEFLHMCVEMDKLLSFEEIDQNGYFHFKPKKRKRETELEGENVEGQPPEKKFKEKQTFKVKGRAAVHPQCEIADEVHVI